MGDGGILGGGNGGGGLFGKGGEGGGWFIINDVILVSPSEVGFRKVAK